ncbi:H/ACA ribonucleoprotein complex subunit 2-like protein [Zingiber officinale]|uniref:H/ACA ribonucleoprotein complex subunit 2-like protein n=1 Tax=Zingiber officinale TaxID=94328 RepID=UPI001C4ADFAD|nr:H/ACA ribonucleoprotein complex subunit 2-like protein [Zingiber officinale]
MCPSYWRKLTFLISMFLQKSQTARLTTEILLAPCSSTLGNSLPISPDLAVAGVTKRPTCCELVTTKPIKGELTQDVQEKLQADYNQVVAEVKELTASLF